MERTIENAWTVFRGDGPGDAGEEAELVRRAQAGDPEAYDELVRSHYPRIYGSAFHLCGNHEDAEDLAQECFVRSHGALGFYRGEGSLHGWLYRILVHLARDRFRREARRPVREPLSELALPTTADGPPAQLGRRELVRLVSEGMRRLPERLRLPLVLRTLEGLDYESIARTTGVTPATARTQVMKARRALLRIMAPHLERREP